MEKDEEDEERLLLYDIFDYVLTCNNYYGSIVELGAVQIRGQRRRPWKLCQILSLVV